MTSASRFVVAPRSLAVTILLLLSALAYAADVPRYAYAVNYNDNTVSVFLVENATGHFRHFGYAATCAFPRSLTVVLNRFVYIACDTTQSNQTSLWAYRTNANGTLRKIGNYQTGVHTSAVTSDPGGRFVYATSWNDHTITGFSVDSTTGTLTRVPGTPTHTTAQPFNVAVNPTGRFLFVASSWSGYVAAYRIGADGALTPVAGSPFKAGSGTFAVAVDPMNRFVYAVNTFSNDVWGYRLDANTGVLTPVPGTPSAAGTEPKSLAIDRTGRFLYVGNLRSGTVWGYAIDQSSGALIGVPGSPFTVGREPKSLVVDVTNRFLYVANSATQDVASFRIDTSTGSLTEVTRNRVRTRGNAFALALANGASAVQFVNNLLLGVYFYEPSDGGRITASRIAADGSLSTPADKILEFSYFPQRAAMDPFGRFMFVNGFAGPAAKLDSYKVTATDVTRVESPPFFRGQNTGPIAVEASGRFLYELLGGPSPNIQAYSINASTGAISPVHTFGVGVPYDAVGTALATDPNGKFLFVGVASRDFTAGSDIITLRINRSDGTLSDQRISIRTPFPETLTVDVSGKFLYQTTSQEVIAYRVSAYAGALARVNSISASSVGELRTEPSGRFLYGPSVGGVQAFAIGSITGRLSRVEGSPFLLINPGVDNVSADWRGRYVYGAAGNSAVRAGSIQSSGALTEIPGSPFTVIDDQVEIRSMFVRGTVK